MVLIEAARSFATCLGHSFNLRFDRTEIRGAAVNYENCK
jgi:hypothetical protein